MLKVSDHVLIDNEWASMEASPNIFEKDISDEAGRHDPIPFPTPKVDMGIYMDVSVQYVGRERIIASSLVNCMNPNYAYVEQIEKPRIPTNMGYVMFCEVATRIVCERQKERLLFEVPEDPMTVAVKVSSWQKVMAYRSTGKAEDPLNEVGAMQYVGDNNHVLGCVDLISDEKYLYMVMPFLAQGDLLSLISDERIGGLPEPIARNIFRQILSTLRYLKQRGVVHRDISSENIMLGDEGQCILIDMGMALRVPKRMEGRRRSKIAGRGKCGKFAYMAPEIYADADFFDGYAIDLWSCAVVLFTMLTGPNQAAMDDDRLLYEVASPMDPIFRELTSADGRGLERLLSRWELTMSKDAIDLLQRMFRVNPLDRPTLEEIMTHPWVTKPDVATNSDLTRFMIIKRMKKMGLWRTPEYEPAF